MATFERHVEVNWQGSVMEGNGVAKAGTGAFSLPVQVPSPQPIATSETSATAHHDLTIVHNLEVSREEPARRGL